MTRAALHCTQQQQQINWNPWKKLGCDKRKENNNLEWPWDLSTDDNVKTLLPFKLRTTEVHPIKFVSAEQSSTEYSCLAETAINGNIDTITGVFTHTNWKRSPWWKGKLQLSTIFVLKS